MRKEWAMGNGLTMWRSFVAVAMMMVFGIFASQATAGQRVNTAGDSGPGSLRVVIGSAGNGETITFGGSIHPVIENAGNIIIQSANLTISGNTDAAGNPLTTITIPTGATRTEQIFAGDTNSNGFALQNLVFRGIHVNNLGQNSAGSIVGLASSDSDIIIGNLDNTSFINNSAEWTTNLLGGGLLGARANDNATIGDIGHNVSFTSNTILINDIMEGGGLVGVKSENGTATIGAIGRDVSFINNKVTAGTSFFGGGLVGAFSRFNSAFVGAADGIGGTFLGNSITTTSSGSPIFGGGLIGAIANIPGMEDGAEIGNILSNTVFGGSGEGEGNVITAVVVGGGLVGAAALSTAAGWARIGTIGENVSFIANTVSSNLGMQGGGLVGAYANFDAATIGSAGKNLFFINNTISTENILAGGGLVGALSGTNSATIGMSHGFGGKYVGNNVIVRNGSIHGGGLIGASGNGAAGGDGEIGTIVSGSVFGGYGLNEGNIVSTDQYIQGGGLVGAQSETGTARINAIEANVSFINNKITAGGTVNGGGLVGAYSGSGSASVGVADGIGGAFLGNSITTTGSGFPILGGGLIGAYASFPVVEGGAEIGNILSNTVFGGLGEGEGNVITSLVVGGGLVGAAALSNSAGWARIGTIGENVSFIANTVSSNLGMQGGGLVGAYANFDAATIGSAGKNLFFINNTISTENILAGGGLVGALSGTNSATIGMSHGFGGKYVGNNVIVRNGSIHGGGLIGASGNGAAGGDGEIGTIVSGSVFGGYGLNEGNIVSTDQYIQGGGLVGAQSETGTARINAIEANVSFINNKVTADYIEGGGLVGAYSGSGSAVVGMADGIGGSYVGNSITADSYITGGGIIGAYADNTGIGTGTAGLGALKSASFTDNTVSVGEKAGAGNAWALGSVIGVSGLDSAWTITDTILLDNKLTIHNHNAAVTAGSIFVGTDHVTANGSHQVIVNGDTSISGNTVTYSGGTMRQNSFHFGRGWNTATNTELYDSLADASLTLAPGAGKTVSLLDPISVDMNNGKKFDYSIAGAGMVELAGLNLLDAAGGSTFTASSGTLYLASDFSLANGSPALDGSTNNGTLDIRLDNSSGRLGLVFDLLNRDNNLAMFANPDSFAVVGQPGRGRVDVSVAANTFSPELVSGKWLITDNRDGVDKEKFQITAPDSDLQFLTEGDNLYLSGTASTAPTNVRNNPNPNVRSSFFSGSLNQAWIAAKTQLDLSISDEDALFSRIAANPEQVTAEAFASSAMAAMDTAGRMWSSVRSLAGLDVAGGWQREESAVSSVSSHTASASIASPSARGLDFWAGAFGSRSDRNARGGAYGYDSRLYGGGVGGTYVFNQVWRSGLYLSYGREKTHFDNIGAKNTADVWQAGGFVETRLNSRWGVRADISHTWFDNELEHSTPVGQYNADFDQRVFALGLESGFDFRPGDGYTLLTPFAGFRWQHLSQDSATEQAASGAANAFASRLDSVSANSAVSSLGVDVSRDIRLSQGRRLLPSLRAAWNHEFGDTSVNGNAGYSGVAGSYRLSSLVKSRDTASFAARMTARVRESASGSVDLMAGVDATFGRGYSDYGFRVGVRVEF